MESVKLAEYSFTGWITELARAHARGLLGVARGEGLTADDGLDAVQEAFETFLRLPQARGLVGEGDDSRAILAAIVRNAARNMRRRHFRAKAHVELGDAVELADEVPGSDEIVARAERHVRPHGCVNRLAEVQRHVVRLRAFEELSGGDVAEAVGLEPGHIAVMLHRAKQALLRCMAEESG